MGLFFSTWADGESRFDAALNILRTSLYPLSLSKVSAMEVEAMLRRLAECDLGKLCGYNGKVYGKVSRGRTAASNCAHRFDASALGNVVCGGRVSAAGAANKATFNVEVERIT